ncbi:hypothetical protein [Actinomyces sp. oral taxon 171]|uniref:hypothetical protein n=1 Tax=Actinomyces sp. oral taxon 171 TaxID=706438 RepID=UPI0001F61F9B|nr:hypothetical protein [Actinomyces sp. oral taxon 171]EFW26502.1 hypothetical protein HMPREF9057_02123 [Actinomyces sp. oral taxon 171 str. F0337]QCT34020.1 hypothetical protein FBF36_11605 [Actinomyces sp. oral taxon 171 str. F0337]
MRRLSTTPRLFIILSLLPLLLTSMIALTPAAPVATAEEKTEANADADGSGNVGDNGGEADAGADPTGQSLQEPVYTAAPLPTVQIDGVAWGQLVVGDVVYVVGSFNSARPAGALAGQQEVPRSNILAYDLTTGELIEDFAPTLNGAGRSLALSEDGKTLYVAGEFDRVNDEWHSRLAAFDISHGHGTLISSFQPVFSTTVKDIAVAGDTLYVGGYFTKVNKQQRTRLAALKASTGELLDWTASAEGPNAQVYAIEVSPDHSKVVIGGSFSSVNGSSRPGYGMALLDASTGEVLPMPVNDTVRTAGEKAAIFDIAVDDAGFYATAYSAVGRLDEANLEGSFKADWNGNLIWLEPCHGDTYGIAPTKEIVYTVGHAHSCETIYGFPNMPEVRKDGSHPLYVRAMAFTNSPDITIRQQGVADGYQDWSTSGLKSPTIIGWYPDLEAGKVTKMSQAAYKVDVTDKYVLMVGEFIEADGKVQQGIVRYPRRAGQPTLPPEGKAENLAARAEVTTSGSVKVSFTATWDRDDPTLTYSLYRDNETTPVATEKISDTRWALNDHSLEDTTCSAGEHTYRLVVSDPSGNTITAQMPSVTVPRKADNADPANADDAAKNADQDGNNQANADDEADGSPEEKDGH